MSQIRVDKTLIVSVDVPLLKGIVEQIAVDRHGRVSATEPAFNYDKTESKNQRSDIGVVYFDATIKRGIAVNTKNGLSFAGDPYGYTTQYNDFTDGVTGRMLDATLEAALRDGLYAVTKSPLPNNKGTEFVATDAGGKQIIILRDRNGGLSTTFKGFEGQTCQDAQKLVKRLLAARGITLDEVSVVPTNDEKWQEQRLAVIGMN